MILRKPYAFFIKQFKTIHLILTVLITFLLYRTIILISFFNECMRTSGLNVDPVAPDKLFSAITFGLPVIIILMSTLILAILYLKKKPALFYFINILIYIGIIVIFAIALSTLKEMIFHVVSLQSIKLTRDLLLVVALGQLISLVRFLVYSIGFDIKKFNFGEDLTKLEIEDDDDEEFEVNIELDTDLMHRNTRRKVRFSKYVYIENKFLIDHALLLLLGIIILLVYFNQNIYNKFYNEGTVFSTKDFTMKVDRSFITKLNPQNQERSRFGMSFAVVELELRSNGNFKKIDVAKTKFIANANAYYHVFGLNNIVNDIGNVYNNEEVRGKFIKYLLIYEIPDEYLSKGKLRFKYLDVFRLTKKGWQPKYININLKPKKLDIKTSTITYNIGDTLLFSKSILEETTLLINNFDFSKKYTLDYDFCVNDEECYKLVEYIKPNIYNVHDKTIMRLNGILNWDNSLVVGPITSVFQFVNQFAVLKYEINGQQKTQNVKLVEIKPQKSKKVNTYYIEVLAEVEKADKIALFFKIRDKEFIYELQ